MPLGFERLNERQQRPNPKINFIKPLEGPDKAAAEEYLSRIAAQCYPVMKKHYVSVMALEEYEPNPEFLGRNFNAGEVIQLVLKDKQGRWLPMHFVQMVMMHELAHCKQMNHSRYFWNVRNEYAKQMEDLWKEGYVGEGMWGRGRGLSNGGFVNATPPDNAQIPEHLCGGSYRRRGRKRRRGQNSKDQPEKLTYAERQQRRIARKFGQHGGGESLGDDELLRGALETMNGGKRGQGKPKVANSKRGRELRAAAALARFSQAKKREETPELEEDLDSETESEPEEIDRNAVTISDGHGRDFVKVCGDGEDEEDANKEMNELRMLSAPPTRKPASQSRSRIPGPGDEGHDDSETQSEPDDLPPTRRKRKPSPASRTVKQAPPTTSKNGSGTEDGLDRKPQEPSAPAMQERDDNRSASQADLSCEIDPGNGPQPEDLHSKSAAAPTSAPPIAETSTLPASLACAVCSLESGPDALRCDACSNVLKPKLVAGSWRCIGDTCKGSVYLNAGDVGRCGLCGCAKPNTIAATAAIDGPMGITRPEVLRWD